MNIKSIASMVAIVSTLVGCASSGETVLARADRLTSTPSWASFTIASFQEGSIIKFVGNHELGPDQRISSGCKIAANKAKGEIAGEVQQKLSFVFQHAEEGTGLDTDQTKYIGGEASKLVISNLHYDGCYWELIKPAVGNSRYRFFSKMSIPQRELAAAISKASGGRLSPEFSKQVTAHWDDLTGMNTAELMKSETKTEEE